MTKVRNKKLLSQFGIHLRKVRIENSLSQEQLANDADIPINQIGRIERGEINPSLSTLDAIAKAFRISLSELVDF
ncbi:MAG: helix-turn-helix transcriptional regulator [Cyclobacteriaceae bacterium]|nr:helix-turn-helix transcriptional regulator [Cyclobacteriaceae bacterium]